MNIRKTIITTAVALTTVAMIAPVSAGAMTAAELQAQINALMAQLQAMQGPATGTPAQCAGVTFSRNLTVGSTGPDVTCLQALLHVTPMSGYFGPITLAAVQKYQSEQGWAPAQQVGPMTRAKLNTWLSGSAVVTTPPSGLPAGCTSTVGYSPTTGMPCSGSTPTSTTTLMGGAGSVDDWKLLSSPADLREVGEGEKDVKVIGISIEADNSSDLRLTAVKVVFDEGTAASDFNDYAKEVSLWLGDKEIGRVSADEFTDDNNWTKTISVAPTAIVKADAKANLYVAVSGISNLDSGDAGDTWTVDLPQVRFVDATGASTSEDPTTAVRTFSFESFASAADVELKIALDQKSVNDARVIEVDSSDDTDNVSILSFTMEAKGTSKVTVKDVPILFTTTETTGTDPADLMTIAYLYAGGTLIGTESFTDNGDDSVDTVVFDDLDYTINAGAKVSFLVKAKFVSTGDNLDNGDTVKAEIGETQTDSASFDAEDANGDNLADADKTGAATSETHTMYDTSFNFSKKSTTAAITSPADPATSASADVATYSEKFELTAFGGDVTIDRSCEEGGANAVDQGVEYIVTNSASNTTACSLTSTADDNPDDSGASWLLREGETKEFTLTVAVTATASHFAKIYLESINWDDVTTDATPDLYYTAGLGETKTSTSELYLKVTP